MCDGIDNNCTGVTDEGFADFDTDGSADCVDTDDDDDNDPDTSDCDDNNAAIHSNATEVCDAVDNNCTGGTDEGFDLDGDGFTTCGADGILGGAGIADDDCNDTPPGGGDINPNANEVSNSADDNCNSLIDQNDPNFDADEDNDGFNDEDCGGNDCDDSDIAVNLSATEVVGNNIDDNCNGTIDEVAPFTFAEVFQVVNSNCGCHTGSNSEWNHTGTESSLATAWINVNAGQNSSMRRIEPFDSSESYVMHKLDDTHQGAGGGGGSRMPLGSPSGLDQVTLDRIRAWIDDGASTSN